MYVPYEIQTTNSTIFIKPNYMNNDYFVCFKQVPNSCNLVWEGIHQRRLFGEVKPKSFLLEKMAREFFQKHQVEHFWDLAYSGAVLEVSEEP